jgi:lipoate-protein ligase A
MPHTPAQEETAGAWELRLDPPQEGVANMQTDEALLRTAEECAERFTVVRFYQWLKPTVSLGKHQAPERAVDFEYCRRHGIPLVHRPTGGRAVLHADELTYAVVSNDPEAFPANNVSGTYFVIAVALQAGLRELGVQTELAPALREHGSEFQRPVQLPCFATPSRHELLCGGRKVAGSAQRRLRRSFLQHGSIPLRLDYAEMGRVLGVSEGFLRSAMISVSEAAGREVDFDLLANALGAGFRRAFGRPR